MTRTARSGLVLALAAAAALSVARPAEAQRPPRAPAGLPSVGPLEAPPSFGQSAEQTRQQLADLLQSYPPSLPRVLKLDPTLLRNADYLAAYPELATFVRQHPEIERNPEYYFERYAVSGYARDPRRDTHELIAALAAGTAALIVFAIVISVIVWIVRTTLEQRRWNRLSKVQAEVHTKLMDRLASNEELLTYVQTASGKRFLESGPSPLQEEPMRALGAPFSRILWSVQAGVVLGMAGVGLLYVSQRFLTDSEPAQFFFVIGVLALALGAGFVVSAGAAFLLSRRLGLFERPASDHA